MEEFSVKITEWQNEDTMTEDSMYDVLFSLSKVDGVRMFPKKMEVVNDSEKERLREQLKSIIPSIENIIDYYMPSPSSIEFFDNWLEKSKDALSQTEG